MLNLDTDDLNPTPAVQTAPDPVVPGAQPDTPADQAAAGAGEDLRSPIERRLDEIANTEDLSTLRRQPQGHDIPDGPEELPAGFTRDAQGKLRDAAGNFATLTPKPAVDPAVSGGGEGGEADPAAAAAVPVKLWLPGRGPQAPDVELELTPEAIAALQPILDAKGITVQQLTESVAQTRNGYARKQQLADERRVFQQELEDVRLIERELGNPKTAADFVMTKVAPSTRLEVARQILASVTDKEFETLMETATGWDRDRTARTTAAVTEENRRLKGAEQARADRAAAQADTQQASAISEAVQELIPADWSQARAEAGYKFACQRLIEHLDRTNTDVTPAQVPALLEKLGVMEFFGLKPGDAAAARPVAPSKPDAAAVARAQQHGVKVQGRVAARQAAAAVSPAGSGAAIHGTRPPAKQTFEQRMEWIAKHGAPS